MRMSRTQLFSQGFSIMMRCGPMWLVALAVAAVDLLLGQVLPTSGILGSILSTLRGVITGAFLTGALIVLANAVADQQPVSFGDGFKAGTRFYPVLLAVDLILAAPTFAISQLMNLFLAPLTSSLPQNPTPANLDKILSTVGVMLCVLLPLLLLALLLVVSITSAIGLGAERSVALDGAGVGRSLKRGWDLLTEKLGDMFVIGLIMLGIGIVFAVLFGCAAFILALGSSMLVANLTSSISNFSSNPVFGIVMALAMMPLQLLFSTVWTLAFRRWQGKDQPQPLAQPQAQPPVIPPAIPPADPPPAA